MSIFDKLHVQVKEAVAIHEAVRRLGFDQTQIGITVLKGQGAVCLFEKGEPFFNITVGPLIDILPQVFCGNWKNAVLDIHHGNASNENVQALIEGSQIFQNVHRLVDGLMEKGYNFKLGGVYECSGNAKNNH